MTSKGRPTPWQQRRFWPALFLGLWCTCSATAQSSPTLLDAVEQLKQEAASARQAMNIPQRPDFARRFDGTIDPAEALEAVAQRVDRDPFIDAYVRWQLTSFKLQPRWNQQDFLHVLRDLPPLIHNPRGDAQLLDLLQRAVETAPLAPSDLSRLDALSHELDERTADAEWLCRPALELRHWLRESLDEAGPQRLQAMIEQCAATIEAAWSTQGIKMRLSNALSASADDEQLTNAHRRMIVEQLQALVGRHRKFVNEIALLANGTVEVTYTNARVTQRDVDAWIERMAGRR